MVEWMLPAVLTTGLVGLTASVVLVVVSRLFAVREDPLVGQVNELLPGANCGGCGYAGCRAFAEALVTTRDPKLTCPVCALPARESIGALLGIELSSQAPMVAHLRCNGTRANATQLAQYLGLQDCHAEVLLYQGHKTCSHGCLGLGTCVRACMFDAIHTTKSGIVAVDEQRCTGCSTCVEACPKDLLVMVPKGARVVVACANAERAGTTRKDCKVGCIGCRKCQKTCPDDAIHIVDNLARVDQDRCTRCQACIDVCPVGCIHAWHLQAADLQASQLEEQPEEQAKEQAEEQSA